MNVAAKLSAVAFALCLFGAHEALAQSWSGGGGSAVAPITLNATIGTNNGGIAGTGIVGIGTAPVRGDALIVAAPSVDMSTNDEYLATWFTATNTPTSPAVSGTGLFGNFTTTLWAGSIDSSAHGRAFASEDYAYLTGSASMERAVGLEGAALNQSSGTMVSGYGVWGHVENLSPAVGTITNGYAFEASIKNPTGTLTNSEGLHVESLEGANVYGIYINNQSLGTSSNYAIWTNNGAVHLGDTVAITGAVTANTFAPQTVTIGDGGATNSGLIVNGTSAQGPNLFTLKAGGTQVFGVSSSGTTTITQDLNLATHTLILQNGSSVQKVRGTSAGLSSASDISVRWSSDTTAFGTVDTTLCRQGAGVIEVGASTGCAATGSLLSTNLTSSGTITFAGVTTGTNADFACFAAGGVMTLQTTSCTISSKRFKNIAGAYNGDAVRGLLRLDVDEFRFKPMPVANPDPNYNALQVGLIAENVAQVFPKCAVYENDMKTPKSYRQECMIAILVKAAQEQQAEIEALKAEVEHDNAVIASFEHPLINDEMLPAWMPSRYYSKILPVSQ